MQNEEQTKRSLPSRSTVAKTAANVLLVAVVFGLGVWVGNGHLTFQKTGNHTENGALPSKLDYSSVNDVYQQLKKNYDGTLTQSQLEDGLKHGLAAAAKDPYTMYFTAKEAQDFNSELNNSFSGIGAQLGQDSDGNVEIMSPIDDLPAAKAGLKAKDLITSIDGTSTSGMSVDDAVTKIRGKKGTVVKLGILRDKTQVLTISVTRDDITLPSVKSKTLDGNICDIQISTFADDTASLAQKAADDCKKSNPKGIVLDLRDNPGGLVDAAVSVVGHWLPTGTTILQEKRGSTVIDTQSASGDAELKGIPTVVLINSGSASASEITAGALHDNNAATLIGEKSYGKGVVQQLVPFADGSQLKVTIASWYRPNGQNINHKGITPDQAVKISDDDAKAGTDTQLNAAQASLNK